MQQLAAAAMVAATALGFAATPAYAQGEQQVLVNQADTTLSNFMRDPEMKWLQQNIGRAKAVLIVAGNRQGRLHHRRLRRPRRCWSRKSGGKWVGPAFYTLATASIGFQAGVAASRNGHARDDRQGHELAARRARSSSARDASVAAGPVGAGAKSDVVADLITFSRSKGVYGGLNLDGTVVSVNDDWNKAYLRQAGAAARHPDQGQRQQQGRRQAAGRSYQGRRK